MDSKNIKISELLVLKIIDLGVKNQRELLEKFNKKSGQNFKEGWLSKLLSKFREIGWIKELKLTKSGKYFSDFYSRIGHKL